MLYVQPGQTTEIAAQNLKPNSTGTVGVQVLSAPAGGTVVTARTTSGIAEEPTGSGEYGKSNLVAPSTGGQYWIRWDSGLNTAPYATEELVVAYTHPATVTGETFATPDDVAARLGRALTEAEEAQVDFLLLAATVIITDAVNKDAEWAAGLDVPTLFRFICADMVVRALNFSPGVSSTTESLGEYSYSERGDSEYGGLWLSALERRMLRRTVWGSGSGSARVESIVTDLVPVDP